MSLYIPPSAANPTPQILDDLVTQIPAPVLFMGDVNAQHPAWGGDQRDTRGNIFENFISKHNLTVLNTGEGTRLNPAFAGVLRHPRLAGGGALNAPTS